MQYHAQALARRGADVDLIGLGGSAVHPALRDQARITLCLLPERVWAGRHGVPRPLFIAYTGARVALQSIRLLWTLLVGIRRPDIILIQNPPAVPTLVAARLVAWLRGARLVIDWHNFGYTMLAMTLGLHHPAVRAARWYERTAGRWADAHLCVSRAMQTELAAHWGVQATVLYDRPAGEFAPTPAAARDALFTRLQHVIGISCLTGPPQARAAVLVSPTSWTADEDFAVLLEAAAICDQRIATEVSAGGPPFPDLVVLLTGKGPLRAAYEARLQALRLRKVHLRTLWLEPEDYPVLLGAADLGLCLHRSSSGLDLPMKVADMFGAGLPVAALDYGPCLAERVRHGENGIVFSNATELAEQLCDLFKGFPRECMRLDALRRRVAQQSQSRWVDGWDADALPAFLAVQEG